MYKGKHRAPVAPLRPSVPTTVWLILATLVITIVVVMMAQPQHTPAPGQSANSAERSLDDAWYAHAETVEVIERAVELQGWQP